MKIILLLAISVTAHGQFLQQVNTTEPGLRFPALTAITRNAQGEEVRAAPEGLFTKASGARQWTPVYPRTATRSWAPRDVKGAVYDAIGRLWFASAQGIGVRETNGDWRLYTTEDGMPVSGLTSLAIAPDSSVWLGTTKGAIHFDGKTWEYRQGPRWLPDDNVSAIAVDAQNNVWMQTAKGVARLSHKPMSYAEKAKFFEDEIDRYHRRTPYQYVLEVSLDKPGDKSKTTQHDSDNDGLWTSMYGAGECYAWAATKDPQAKKRAKMAFDALRFLGTVTQGGDHPAPKGYVARTVLPAANGNPNDKDYTPEKDRIFQQTRDKYWKIMNPRWPKSADGQWYWKADTSSDELDGHYFFYGLYFDLVAKGDPAEEQLVKNHVAALTDHLIDHNFQLVDWDGKVTRWGVFNPEELNHNIMWADDRMLNSLSILAYLKTVEHITGNPKYKQAADGLIGNHGYDINVMMAKSNGGPGAGNQSDDEMAFMMLYNALRYETDPRLRAIYGITLRRRWDVERPELNPLFNFIAASALKGEKYTDTHSTRDLTLTGDWLEESIDSLRRFPLDRVSWRLSNSDRADIQTIGRNRGHRRDGRVLPIDERFVNQWNHDPWQLDQGGDGRMLGSGAAFLLPYYMGLYHGFLK